MSAKSKQVGGNHYAEMVIQPAEFCEANKLSFCESMAIKYLCRWRKKNDGKNGIEDLQKAQHCIQLLIEMEAEKDADVRAKIDV